MVATTNDVSNWYCMFRFEWNGRQIRITDVRRTNFQLRCKCTMNVVKLQLRVAGGKWAREEAITWLARCCLLFSGRRWTVTRYYTRCTTSSNPFHSILMLDLCRMHKDTETEDETRTITVTMLIYEYTSWSNSNETRNLNRRWFSTLNEGCVCVSMCVRALFSAFQALTIHTGFIPRDLQSYWIYYGDEDMHFTFDGRTTRQLMLNVIVIAIAQSFSSKKMSKQCFHYIIRFS